MAGHPSIVQGTEGNTVRPKTEFAEKYHNPMHDHHNENNIEDDVENGKDENDWETMAKKFEELETKLTEQFEGHDGAGRGDPPMIKAPTKPTKEEWERHQTTHTPYASWCKHCVAARNVRRSHPAKGRKGKIVPDVEKGDGPTKVSLDYMYLHDRVGRYRDVQHNPPYLVVIEHKHGRCWAHQVPNKGVNDGAHWVPKRILQDLDNNGLGDTRILLKTDQEPSIVCAQRAIQDLKPDIIPINSPVGESASNGRIENAIRRVQEKMRTLRHQLEKGIGQTIPDQSAIMAWLAKWSAELISKYAPGDDGKTPYERIRQETCKVPLVPFGEAIMYLPMKTAKASKGTPARKPGIWLGVIERTEETIVGTENGVVKCRTVSRMAEGEQWNRERVLRMRGSPWEPVPGKQSMHIPVDVDDNGEDPEGDEGCETKPTDALDDEVPVELRGGVDKLHISRKAIARYGATIGCPGCNDLSKRGQRPGKITYKHSDECRNRIIENMEGDPEYKKLLERHGVTIGMLNAEVLTEVQVNIRKHQVEKAIEEIERRERQHKRSVKEVGLNQMMRKIMFEQMEVAEVYSPPRVTKMARRMGLRAGWSLDLTTCDENGRPWDFNDKSMRNAAVRKLLKDRPRLLMGSPMCGPFSSMNNINYSRMSTAEKEQRLAYGRKHLEFCMQLYELQWREGRYFVHEHPEAASSWNEQCVRQMMNRQGVIQVTGDQCRYGLTSWDGQRRGPARKRTKFMTNSPCIAKALSLRCPNTREHKVHEHVVLINGRAKRAEVYPPALCRAICNGLLEQMEADRKGQFLLAQVDNKEGQKSDDLAKEAEQFKQRYRTAEEEDDPNLETAWDDVSGAELDPKEVKRARAEEVEYVRKMKLYTKVPIDECYKKTGKAPITVRWIDINKGDKLNPNYRSRLVAREINTHKRDDLFAGTPPLDRLRASCQ